MCPTHLIVNGDAVGPANTDVHQHGSVRSIQTRSFYAWILSPLRPKQIPAHTTSHEESAASFMPQKRTITERKLLRVTQISPFLRMYSNGPRFVQSLGDDHISKRAIQSGNLNHIKALVRPVDVSYSTQRNKVLLISIIIKLKTHLKVAKVSVL